MQEKYYKIAIKKLYNIYYNLTEKEVKEMLDIAILQYGSLGEAYTILSNK